ncbi:MAG: hypothetical protein IJN50_00615 [Clostridia bacterium]|nr:hypothetical protein [Clostridia bacterium]
MLYEAQGYDYSGYWQVGVSQVDNVTEKELEEDNKTTPQNIKVVLVPTYMSEEELATTGIVPSATVEAEYGEKVIEGKQATLAHHTERYKNNPAPCNTPNIPILADDSTIVISHLDLDTLGGIAALIGRKKDDSEFWKAAEFIDLNGPHNLFQLDEKTREKYVAYQAYQANHRTPRFTEITDVTDVVLDYLEIIDKVIDGDKSLIEEGKIWDEQTKGAIEECLVFENDNVRVFSSPNGVFCSASYYSEKLGKVIPCTVTFNGKFKSVTVAMADGGKQISAKELVQRLWGNEAGGHSGIAGSPRGKEMTEEDLKKAAEMAIELISRENRMYTVNEIVEGINPKQGELAGAEKETVKIAAPVIDENKKGETQAD